MCWDRRKNQKIKDLSINDFKKILDKTQADFVKLWGRGEPFLNRDIYDIIRVCKDRKTKVFITTNFSLIDLDEDIVRDIDMLCVSLHAATSDTYKKVTHRNDFNEIIEKIRKYRAKNKNYVAIKMVVSSINEKEISKFIQLGSDLEVDDILLTGIDFKSDASSATIKKLLMKTREGLLFSRYSNRYKKCQQYKWPYVLCDGRVFTCCKSPERGFMGNVFSDTFHLDKQKIMESSKRKFKECEECTLC